MGIYDIRISIRTKLNIAFKHYVYSKVSKTGITYIPCFDLTIDEHKVNVKIFLNKLTLLNQYACHRLIADCKEYINTILSQEDFKHIVAISFYKDKQLVSFYIPVQ
jgi:hypothetical protein